MGCVWLTSNIKKLRLGAYGEKASVNDDLNNEKKEKFEKFRENRENIFFYING